MNTTTETLRASVEDPTKAIQALTTFGFTGADRFAELNVSAGLAALDNSTHHFSTLASSKRLDDLIGSKFNLCCLPPKAQKPMSVRWSLSGWRRAVGLSDLLKAKY